MKNRDAVVDAYSQYQVEEHVGASKNFGPLMKFQVEWIDAMTPASVGNCDQKALTKCIDHRQLSGEMQITPEYLQCVTKAGCQNNYMEATPAQKQELANSFKTSVGTLDKAYAKMNDKFMGNLQQAKEANDVRKAKLIANFKKAVDHEADLLGCNKKCYKQGLNNGVCPTKIFAKCCNDGVIRVHYATVNTAAVVENVYGDVENLTQEDIVEINQSLQSFQ